MDDICELMDDICELTPEAELRTIRANPPRHRYTHPECSLRIGADRIQIPTPPGIAKQQCDRDGSDECANKEVRDSEYGA